MKNLKVLSLFACAFLMSSLSSYAQEATTESSESSLKIEDVTGQKNKVAGEEDMDSVITNKKMRAEAGSKSKFSASAALTYSGGSLEKPLAEDRPNITGATGQTLKASLGGSLGVGYRISPTDRLGLDVGVRWITPLETSSPKNYDGDRFDASNPSISYGKVYKWSGIQSSFSAGPTLYTNSNLRKAGFVGSFDVSQNNVYDIGTTGLGVGLLVAAGTGFYDKDGIYKEMQSDYNMGAYPFLEYTINDTFNVRTISGVWVYEHIRAENDAWTFSKNKIYQSVGLGISVTRDLFLYPNIQFIPENIRSDNTNVAITANINMF